MDPEEAQDLFTNVELILADGRSIFIQALDVEPTDVAFEGLTAKFSDVAHTIGDIARITADTLSAVKPTEATLEFGVDIGVKSGAVVSIFGSGESKAAIKVTLKWASDPSVTLPVTLQWDREAAR